MNTPYRASEEIPAVIRADGSLLTPLAHDAHLVGVAFRPEAGVVVLELREESSRRTDLVLSGVVVLGLNYLSTDNILFDIVVRPALKMTAEDRGYAEQVLQDSHPGWVEHVIDGNWFVRLDPTMGAEGVIVCRRISVVICNV